jgi:hypothetical protein
MLRARVAPPPRGGDGVIVTPETLNVNRNRSTGSTAKLLLRDLESLPGAFFEMN